MTDIRQFKEAPAETTNEIQHRIEQRYFLPQWRQHINGVKAAAEKDQWCYYQQGYKLQLFKAVCPHTDDKTKQGKRNTGEYEKSQHPERVGNFQVYKKACGNKYYGTDDNRFGCGGTYVTQYDFKKRDRC